MHGALTKSLADDLPYEDIINDVIIYSDGSVGAAYALTPVYVDSMELGQIMNMERTLCAFIEGLTPDIGAQIVWRKHSSLSTLETHMSQIQSGDPLLQMMGSGRLEYWSEKCRNKEVFEITCELWLRKKYERVSGKPLNDIWSLVGDEAKIIDRYCQEQEEIAENFNTIVSRLIVPLDTLMKPRRMGAQEIFRSLWSFFCGQDENVPQYKPSVPLKFRFDAIDVSKEWGYITLGNMYERAINVLACRELPETSTMSIINYLLDIPTEYTLTMNIGAVPQGALKNRLRKQLGRNSSVLAKKIDPEALKRVQEIGMLINDLNSTTNKMVNMELFLIIPDTNLTDLDRQVKNITDIALSRMEMRFEQEKAALWPVFMAAIPGACFCGKVKREHLVKSTNVANFMPVLGPITPADKSIMLMGGPYQTLFAYDPFDKRLPASHTLVFGGTGSGKSFTTNLLVLSIASQNPLIFIIDKGGSYKKLVNMLGGSYIDLSTPGISFNPLEGKANWRSRSKAIEQILAEMIREDQNATISSYQQLIISRWVETLFQTFKQDREPTLSDAYDVLTRVKMYNTATEPELEEVQRRICINFSRWTRLGTRNKSPYAQILDNEKTNVTLDNNIVAFDLLGIEKAKDLMNVVFLTINNIILSRVTDPTRLSQRKIIVFDEVWSLLKSEEGAVFIEELYRTMRKYNAMVLSITQDIADFADSSIARALLSNTYQYIILRQTNTGNSERIREILDLNSSEEELIKSVTQIPGLFSEIFLKMAGVGSGKMCIAPSPIEYWFATTKAEDKSLIQNYLNQGMPLEKTLRQLAERFPHGAVEPV